MKRTIYLQLTLLILVLAGTVSAYSQAYGPAKALERLYYAHDAGNGPFGEQPDRVRLDMFFTKRLGDMMWEDLSKKGDEPGIINGDPLYNTQESDIRDFKIGKAVVKGSNATVPVSFLNGTKKERFTYVMKKVGKDWKVDDIKYSATDSLSKWFAKPRK